MSHERFEPTLGKWNDYENYDIEEPTWVQILELAKKYRDVSDVIEVLSWIYNRNIENHAWNEYIAAYGLIGHTECTEKELSDIMFEKKAKKVVEFSNSSHSIDDYSINVFRSTELPEKIIDEFRHRR